MKKIMVLVMLVVFLVLTTLVVQVQAAETATVFCSNTAFRWINVIPVGEVDGVYKTIQIGRFHNQYSADNHPYDQFSFSVSSFACAKVVICFKTESGAERIAIFQLHNISYDGSHWGLAVSQSDMKVTLQTSVGLPDSNGVLTGMDFKYPEQDLLTNPPAHATYHSKGQFNPGDWVWVDTPADGEGAYWWPDTYGEWRFGGRYHWDPVCQIWRGEKNRYEWGGLVVASFKKYSPKYDCWNNVVMVRLYTPDDCSMVFNAYPDKTSPRHHFVLPWSLFLEN